VRNLTAAALGVGPGHIGSVGRCWDCNTCPNYSSSTVGVCGCGHPFIRHGGINDHAAAAQVATPSTYLRFELEKAA